MWRPCAPCAFRPNASIVCSNQDGRDEETKANTSETSGRFISLDEFIKDVGQFAFCKSLTVSATSICRFPPTFRAGLRLVHPELKDRFVVSRANSGEFGVRLFEYDEAQTSTMFAAPMSEEAQIFSFGYRNGVKQCRPRCRR